MSLDRIVTAEQKTRARAILRKLDGQSSFYRFWKIDFLRGTVTELHNGVHTGDIVELIEFTRLVLEQDKSLDET